MIMFKYIVRKVVRMVLPQSKFILWTVQRGFYREVVCKHYVVKQRKLVDDALCLTDPKLIFMANGLMLHGGLSDRLRGIISSYKYAKVHHLPFAIFWNSPFPLRDYLVPNTYDWEIKKDALLYERPASCPICIGSIYKICKKNKQTEEWIQWRTMQRQIEKHKNARQYHIYGNPHFGDAEYHALFHELFQPSIHLQSIIKECLKESKLNDAYIAMTFRFLHLLGDFEEVSCAEVLHVQEREEYIKKCIECIEEVHSEHPSLSILVTSDSQTFLQRVAPIPCVYVIKGRVAHIDSKASCSYDKEFLDLFLLSKAKRIYRVCYGKMYCSGFPITAGLIGNVEVQTLRIC